MIEDDSTIEEMDVVDAEMDALLAAAAARIARRAPQRDHAEGLRRLTAQYTAFQVGLFEKPVWWEAKAAAGAKLESLARWVINQPGAIDKMVALCRVDVYDATDREGALVFGCMLQLTGHPVSARFWWQYAAGADDRVAAYCLYLSELHHGELSAAQVWYDQATCGRGTVDEEVPRSLPCLDTYHDLLILVDEDTPPAPRTPGGHDIDLRIAVERLDFGTDDGIACRPDQRLVDTLSTFTGRG
ncbi:hypothetical protein P3T37_007332 [Kitasatospora sp. MAA4]|uniref:hypothetical protein n=1 Tax=Kitasatospora sp. MAA4 TaxID=3035093 RepID=UPI00247693BB|nr:hypothetical protein [Kitasatospora sp. MAA4]MDH6137894.1 hypothetical protein [Kitasatospora sp. MAA4]